MKNRNPQVIFTAVLLLVAASFQTEWKRRVEAAERPNILFAIADDWSWPHAGAYGDRVVQTPTFDRIAREGVLFTHAYVSSPSCTPSRGAILTGQWHWRLEAGANLWSIFPDKFVSYPEILKQHGYFTGVTGKGWGPGRTATAGRQLCGPRFRNFRQFLKARPAGKPFCFWLGSSDPHRPYKPGSGQASGMDLEKIRLFPCFPDAPEVRSDVADYYFEVQRFDSLVGDALKALEEIGELDNTLVVMTSDNGMPFPRCKSNLYDTGTRMPLAIRWGDRVRGGRRIDDFISFTDFAPTFLEAAGVAIPKNMTGRSFLSLLLDDRSGRLDPTRDHVLVGKERHVPAQEAPDMGGYPCRGLRTDTYFYIRNFRPDRWPAGTPNYEKAAIPGTWYGDVDNGPTKFYMVFNKDRDQTHQRLFALAFGKRPAEELYVVKNDPFQLKNVADAPQYQEVKKQLARRLMSELKATGDPRALGKGDVFDHYPYLGGSPKYPGWQSQKKR